MVRSICDEQRVLPRAVRRLLPDQVHVYLGSTDKAGDPEKLRGVLSLDECHRAERFRFEAHRTRYIVAHAWLREILSTYLDTDPALLQFRGGDFGKPRFACDGPQFNLSHSGDQISIAVSLTDVGIDIERIRPDLRVDDLARCVLSSSEAAWLAAQNPGRVLANFLRLWTLKEAFLKADGRGLSLPIRAVVVEPRGLGHLSPIRCTGAKWEGRELAAPSGYCLATVTARPTEVQVYAIAPYD